MDEPRQSLGERPGVFIKTFGCQMNEYDSEKMYRLLGGEYQQVHRPEDASLVIVNTCSVRDKPEHKLYSLLGELSELKAERPGLLIGVGGCVAQQEGENIVRRNRSVDFVVGTHNLSLIPGLIRNRKLLGRAQIAVEERDGWEELPLGFSEDSRVSRFIAISRGCNKNCTYCIVPTTRGKEVSRSADEILREARIAAHRGAREVVLLGQTVNSYGYDLEPRIRFVDLLRMISELPDVWRIRFTSPHPQEVRQDFWELIETNEKVCKHVHMPVQSGSDRILKWMNRNYRRRRYLEIVQGVRSRCPEIELTTDIIVGFPGETEADFEETMSLLEEVRFVNSFSFMFSPRPGTVAAEMPDDVPHEVKLDRLHRYQRRQSEITAEILASYVGKTVEVLLEGPSSADENRLQGRASQNLCVNLSSHDEALKPGMLVRCHVTEANRFTLRGDCLNVIR